MLRHDAWYVRGSAQWCRGELHGHGGQPTDCDGCAGRHGRRGVRRHVRQCAECAREDCDHGRGPPRGYRVNVAGFGWQNAPVNGSVAFYSIPPGEYSVELQDIASNCTLSGANARAVTVTDGATVELSFAVTCSSATLGSIRVTAVTTGDDIDPNGYQVNDPTDPEDYPILLPANGSVFIDGVLPGDAWLGIWDVASNCAVVGPNDQAVPVNAGATSEVTVVVTCAANLPSIRVTIATTGTDIDPDGYDLYFQGAHISCGTVSLGCPPSVP